MNYRFHPEARAELNAAVYWYEEQQPGLGSELAEEVFAAIDRIRAFPGSGVPLSTGTRRALARRFPYGIIYHSDDQGIFILAVTHLARKPGYWRGRNP